MPIERLSYNPREMNADDRFGSRVLVSAVHVEHGNIVTNHEFTVVKPTLTYSEAEQTKTAVDGFHYTLVECIRLTKELGVDFIGPFIDAIEEYREGLLEKAEKAVKA